MRVAPQHFPEQPEPVMFRHLHVAEHERQIVAAQHLQRGIRAGCLPDGIAFFPEHRGEDVADGPVVVHHQHGGRPPLSDVGIDRRELGRRVEWLAAEPQHLLDFQHPSVR